MVRAGLCSGCGLCEAVAGQESVRIDMSRDGYLRPTVIKLPSLAHMHTIARCCPGLRVELKRSRVAYHSLWGPIVELHAGYATDPELRFQGSSGGVLSALAWLLIERGRVEFVAQIAVATKDPLMNELQLSRTKDDVLRAAGSRYSPSAPLRRIRELLDTGKRFAFIGKPCDVAALRQYGVHDGRVSSQIPYMLSFMCAGIPSQKGTEELVSGLGVEARDVVSLRYRGDGWPGNARVVTRSGNVREMSYNASWGNILNKHLQFRCKICPDGTGEFADVVCADAWYGKDGYPDFAERDGRSLVIARTPVGVDLLELARGCGAVRLETLDLREIERMQPYQAARKKNVLGRVLATRFAVGLAPRYRGLGLVRASFSGSLLGWLRSALGTFKRARGESA